MIFRSAFLSVLLSAVPAVSFGQSAPDMMTSPILDQGTGVQVSSNSILCPFSFFSENDDRLEFRGSANRACFDMKGGADILILNPTAYPEGVDVFSGTGRDVVWTTEVNDKVVDEGSDDATIRTLGGDDRIVLMGDIDRDPRRGVETTPRTVIEPGPGANTIVLGEGPPSDVFARISPNVEMLSAPGASDTITGSCGRPNIGSVFDLRTQDIPETSRIHVNTFGCGVGLFGLFGDAEIDTLGGRLAIQTSATGFRVSAGDNQPLISGRARAGSGLMLNMDDSDPSSEFEWDGYGAAYVISRLPGPDAGGRFSVSADEEVGLNLRLSGSPVRFELSSNRRVQIDIEGRSARTLETVLAAAPRVDISWNVERGTAFPNVVTTETLVSERTNVKMPLIDWFGIDPEGTGEAIPEGEIPDTYEDPVVSTEERVIEPGFVELSIRGRGTPSAAVCGRLEIVDRDGDLPMVTASCGGPGTPMQRLSLRDARGYEEIRIVESGEIWRVEINGASALAVDRIKASM